MSSAGCALSACDALSRSPPITRVLETAEALNCRLHRALTARDALAQEFTEADLSPDFRSNGTAFPPDNEYQSLLAGNFSDYRLAVGGLVRTPMELSLAQLRAMPRRTQITRHDCVEGWSAIGKWAGVPLRTLLAQVSPQAAARYVVFFCADSMDAPGAKYYESIDMEDALHPQTILAYDLNDRPLPIKNGAPLRVRIERQLGYKMAKYIMRVDLVETLADIEGGAGGYWEDRGYEWYAGI